MRSDSCGGVIKVIPFHGSRRDKADLILISLSVWPGPHAGRSCSCYQLRKFKCYVRFGHGMDAMTEAVGKDFVKQLMEDNEIDLQDFCEADDKGDGKHAGKGVGKGADKGVGKGKEVGKGADKGGLSGKDADKGSGSAGSADVLPDTL